MTDDEIWVGPVHDEPAHLILTSSRALLDGRIWSVRRDRVEMPWGTVAERDIVIHPGAVAVLALDEDDRVLLIRQYRHPIGMFLFEIPAGLLDVIDEDPLAAAKRELAEEAGYAADRWQVLVDEANTPGGSSEALRCYLAQGLTELPEGRPHTGEAEEGHLPRVWIPLEEARDLVLTGALTNGTTALAILAAWTARVLEGQGTDLLRPADAPWPIREHLVATDRVRPVAIRTRGDAPDA